MMCDERGLSPTLDKLVIQFNKALDMDLQKLPVTDGVERLNDSWMILGYFDAMQIYPLPAGQNEQERDNWLKAIWSHNIKLSEKLDGSYYIHPFHIMADLSAPERQKEYKQFWDMDKNCLFVTLTQGALKPNGSETYTADELEECIRRHLSTAETDVSCVFYRTLELSDLVIIWKADAITEILKQIQTIYYQPFIGDMNSFCGISYRALKEKAASHPDEPCKPTIPLITMRFAAKHTGKLKRVFDELKKYIASKPYFVTGTEDIHVIWKDISEGDFYRALHHCFLTEVNNAEFRAAFKDAFCEVQTHVGIPDADVSPGEKDEPMGPSRLTIKCQKLFDGFRNVIPKERNSDNDCDYSWMKTVRSQLNAMLDMSRSYVVDGLCYLALDGVSLFCEEVEDLLSKDRPLTSNELEGIQRFVRGWGILIEQAGRADGRFTQLPGFSPPLYDIPSSLLEFYLAFTKRCGNILQAGGSDRNRFAMLMAPKLCRRIKVETIFDFKKPPCPRLLYVDIPLDTLYDPFTVLCQLVHEISHFCGEIWRNRRDRTNKFLAICAYELAAALAMETKGTIADIKEDLDSKCPKEEYYLADLTEAASNAILQLVENDKKFIEWMETSRSKIKFAQPWQEYQWKNWCIAHRAIILSGYSEGPLYQTISVISGLFKECYADVSMIRTLDLSLTEYLNLIEREIRLYDNALDDHKQPDDDINIEGYYVLVQRWTAVCRAVFGGISRCSLPENERLKTFYKHLSHCSNYLDGDLEAADAIHAPYLNAESLNLLIQYLGLCNSQMQSGFPCDDDAGEKLIQLRNAFENIARKHVVGCKDCSCIVSDYEKGLLHI